VGVDVKNRLIQVDERCRTNVPGIWAAGDCASRIMLAHVGSRMAEVAVRDLCGESDRMRWSAIPGVIYTSPEVAGAGLTEEAAKAQGIPVKIAKWNLAANGRFLAEFSGKGLVKAVLHEKTGVLLGVHGVGGGVSEQVAAWSAMIEAEFRLRELTELVFPHPTVSEALRDAAWMLAH
jgi:dihydrolipoamide dehydrogenase